MATGPRWGLPNKMNSPLLPTGPQQIRSEVVSQPVGSVRGSPEPRTHPAQGFLCCFLPGRLDSTRRGRCQGQSHSTQRAPPVSTLGTLLGHDVVGAGVDSAAGQPWA